MNRFHSTTTLADRLALPSRRRFVRDLTLGGLFAGLGVDAHAAFVAPQVPVLSGSEFDLTIGAMPVDFNGARRIATVVNGSLPAPTLRWRQGDTVTLRVRNTLPTTSSIHWHGIVLPADMDGVPGLSFMGIAPGETYIYRFKVNQSGTYWYHGHSRFQEQTGLYGAIVIEPRDPARRADRDHVVLLSDWSDVDPERIYATLKKQSDYYDFGKPAFGDFLRDARMQGLGGALAERRMWNEMRMSPSDLADVSGHAYTYLMNGASPASNWTALFSRGEKVRLRFINGASMSMFDVRIPGLKMRVVAADGQDIDPVTVDEFRIGTAETFDVIVEPDADRAYTIFAQSMDRSGFARGTLAPRAGMGAEVPMLDPRPLLTMRDMMGEMSHAAMPGMDHSKMDHGAMPGMKGMEGSCGAGMATPLRTGPAIDMLVATPRTNLDDPGVGLRDNGRRVLTYADLHTPGAPISADAQRDIELHLTGHMQRYVWSFDGKRFSDAAPLRLTHGERVRITLVNETMMTHPIHLHGMWSELETAQGEFQVRKHTVVVQPAQKLSYRVSADAIGQWAYHCHLLYHMEAGMFRVVEVA
ncbi:MAG: copper resistance system multicopper oxidase [Rudaea sp.]|uniref:copper resistance system multicopper oxidase n=1 Tax=Rudaea sp. TaxID=2136325 RepID=UPI0039E61925